MIKIMIVSNSDMGLYKFRKELIELLLNTYQIHISCPKGDYIEYLTNMGCLFHNSNLNRKSKNIIAEIKLFFSYFKMIKKEKPTLILTFTIKPNIYIGLISRFLSIPVISNVTGLGEPFYRKTFFSSILLALYRTALKKNSHIFFQNENNMYKVINKDFISNYSLIPGSGVNLNEFKALPYEKSTNINLLFISRILKLKGIDEFLNAAKYLKIKYPNSNFHVVGPCEDDYSEILQSLDNQNIIKYHGYQKDTRKFQAFSHCTVFPSYYPEGISNVLLESGASQRPIITSNNSGCIETVIDNYNGYIVSIRNTNDLIKKMEKFILLPYEEKLLLAINSRKYIEKYFDRNIVINSYIKKINIILGAKK